MAAKQAFHPKNIVLFSDGTGNSSSKALKTNVWRMYQAADLGMPALPAQTTGQASAGPIQIGRYDDGVGTSSFRPTAILGSIFGWGLQRNVLSLYLFLCRNYRQSGDAPNSRRDKIYAFGFSRGAFTIRVLADLISDQGLIAHDADPEDIEGLCREAYRAYRANRRPKMPPMRWLVPLYKAIARRAVSGWRGLLGRPTLSSGTVKIHRPDISFLGLWDTVGAYGGPIQELVRAWDEWIIPIKLTDTTLPKKVKRARHALALDDERDAFQPIPWDETQVADDQDIKQVWFAGMHADVGGGYPDDGLAYVSLVWMLDEAQAAGLRFHQWEDEEIRRQADSFGRMHDSRAGLGGYYRYQPRNIGAFFRPPAPGTALIRDADRPDDEGLRLPISVHESVFVRGKSGTDGYAPINIPRNFVVARDLSCPTPALSKQDLASLASPAGNSRRAEGQKAVWDRVWVRRIQYFSIVLFSLLLASMPLWHAIQNPSEAGPGALVRQPLRWVGAHSPWYLAPWPTAFADRPWWALAFGLAIMALFSWGAAVERKLRFIMKNMWVEQLGGPKATIPRPGWIRKLRLSRPYAAITSAIKWHILPFVLGGAILALFAILLLGMLSQSASSYSEMNKLACRGAAQADPTFFSTASRCNDTGLTLHRKQSYIVQFYIGEQWSDGGVPTKPDGLPAGQVLRFGLDRVLVGFRPAVGAQWMQPLVRITSRGGRSYIAPLELKPVGTDNLYEGTFTAPINGRLTLFVNDMVAPWPLPIDLFYRGRPGWPVTRPNQGTACVSVLKDPGEVGGDPTPLTSCPRPPAPHAATMLP